MDPLELPQSKVTERPTPHQESGVETLATEFFIPYFVKLSRIQMLDVLGAVISNSWSRKPHLAKYIYLKS